VRFLELHGIEQQPAGCASATLANMPVDCSLLLTGVVAQTWLKRKTTIFANPSTRTAGKPLSAG
jgi:hypothetical protein